MQIGQIAWPRRLHRPTHFRTFPLLVVVGKVTNSECSMQRHGLTHLLTFNEKDFARFPDAGESIGGYQLGCFLLAAATTVVLEFICPQAKGFSDLRVADTFLAGCLNLDAVVAEGFLSPGGLCGFAGLLGFHLADDGVTGFVT